MTAVLERHAAWLTLFGGRAAIVVHHDDPDAARAALGWATERLRTWHARLTRFEADSELSRLNRDPRPDVPGTPMLLALADAVRVAGAVSGGLVDATQVDALERAGYGASLGPAHAGAALEDGFVPPPRHPAGPDPARHWARVSTDRVRNVVSRPPGVRLDSGGLGKGLAADDIVGRLSHLNRVAVDCAGDLRVGGALPEPRRVLVADPLGDEAVAELVLPATAGVATSGVTRRSWRSGGALAHHLLDPSSGRPAWTGVLQATAVAPTALEAEIRAKAALLSGPDAAPGHLPHGGVLVLDDRRVLEIAPAGR